MEPMCAPQNAEGLYLAVTHSSEKLDLNFMF